MRAQVLPFRIAQARHYPAYGWPRAKRSAKRSVRLRLWWREWRLVALAGLAAVLLAVSR